MRRCDECGELTDVLYEPGLCRDCTMRDMEREEREREAE